MDLKRVYFRNDSKRYVHFKSRWLRRSDLCKHMVWHPQKMLKLLKQILAYSRN